MVLIVAMPGLGELAAGAGTGAEMAATPQEGGSSGLGDMLRAGGESFLGRAAMFNPQLQQGLEFNQKQEAIKRELEKKRMKDAAESQARAGAKSLEGEDIPLAEKYSKLADMLLPLDPELSLKYADAAIDLDDKEFAKKKKNLDYVDKVMEEAADLASGVSDQEQADEFIRWAKENKATLPKWLPPVYNAQTAPAWKKFGESQMGAKDRLALQRETVEAAARLRREQQADRRMQLSERAAERAERLAQERLDKDEKKESDAEQRRKERLNRQPNMTEMDSLTASVGAALTRRAAKVSGGFITQGAMARDVYRLRNDMMIDDKELDPSEAEDDAMEKVLGWVEGGKYLPPKHISKHERTGESEPAGKASTAPGATEANPIPVRTKADLAKIPSGTWVKDLKGKVVRKP